MTPEAIVVVPATIGTVINVYGAAVASGLALGAVCALLASLVSRRR